MRAHTEARGLGEEVRQQGGTERRNEINRNTLSSLADGHLPLLTRVKKQQRVSKRAKKEKKKKAPIAHNHEAVEPHLLAG